MEFLQARRGCKNPSPRRGRTTGPPNQNGWGEENEGGWRTGGGGALKEEEGVGTRWKWRRRQAAGVGSGMCQPRIPEALLLINFAHDQL